MKKKQIKDREILIIESEEYQDPTTSETKKYECPVTGKPGVAFHSEGVQGVIVLKEELEDGTLTREEIYQNLADKKNEIEKKARGDFLVPVNFSHSVH